LSYCVSDAHPTSANQKGATYVQSHCITAAGFIVILSALTLAVQRDRISGVWASDSRPLLELKGEGRTMSGTVHFYQGSTRRASEPIESGSFDERTSGLRLTGRVTLPDGGTVPYVIEGTLQERRLQVSLTLDGSERFSGVLRRLEEPQPR
jgi:hypothetical protein